MSTPEPQTVTIQSFRCTSPEPRARRSPSGSSTSKFPLSSTPLTSPDPSSTPEPSHPISRPASASRAGTRRAPPRPVPPPSAPSPWHTASSASSAVPFPIDTAFSLSSSGNSSRSIERFKPTPTTAQSGGRASIRIPASLRWSSQTSLGHLTRHSPAPTRSAASHTASGTESGSKPCLLESGLTIAEQSSALPAGAVQVRP